MWPVHEGDHTRAYVLFANVNDTVAALNELPDMKINGRRFLIKPCSLEDYRHHEKFKRFKDGRPAYPFEKRSHHADRSDSFERPRRPTQDMDRHESVLHRRESSAGRESGDSQRRSSPHRRVRSRSPRPRSERRRRSREREIVRKRTGSPHRKEDDSVKRSRRNSKTEPGKCVVMSGLPPKTTTKDIAEYLNGCAYVTGKMAFHMDRILVFHLSPIL